MSGMRQCTQLPLEVVMCVPRSPELPDRGGSWRMKYGDRSQRPGLHDTRGVPDHRHARCGPTQLGALGTERLFHTL